MIIQLWTLWRMFIHWLVFWRCSWGTNWSIIFHSNLCIRELKEPMIPWPIMAEMTKVFDQTNIATKEARREAVFKILAKMNVHHMRSLNCLLELLKIITLHSAENKMTSERLAISIGPAIWWDSCCFIQTFKTSLTTAASTMMRKMTRILFRCCCSKTKFWSFWLKNII